MHPRHTNYCIQARKLLRVFFEQNAIVGAIVVQKLNAIVQRLAPATRLSPDRPTPANYCKLAKMLPASPTQSSKA